jgi:glycosyltransferase involved in cell wall biosynthesis
MTTRMSLVTAERPKAVFLVNLVQDVNILRPLIIMASRDFGFRPLVLVSPQFPGRDVFGIWQVEIDQICMDSGAEAIFYATDFEASTHLTGTGVMFAASESALPAHTTTHNVFRYAPSGYLKVTLQHGFECVGFRQSVDHVLAHGATSAFGADLICGWYDPVLLTSVAPSQRAKLHITGPTALLQQPVSEISRAPDAPGIVCENLHSVRLNIAGDFRTQFVDVFGGFCAMLQQHQRKVVLRPHPGGQYVLKNKVSLPANVKINNAPMYKLDLRQFGYGISAPSSVLIDMLLAGIPTAVWRDHGGVMDSDSYAGLTTVSGPGEWLEFSRAAAIDPAPFLAAQRQFLEGLGMPLDPREVFRRYGEIFAAARRIAPRAALAANQHERIMLVANGNVPTLQLSFEKPLAALVERGEIATTLLTEPDLRGIAKEAEGEEGLQTEIDRLMDEVDPRLMVFCRYSGPGYKQLVAWARRRDVPVLYHIDDDLLAIPADIGARKHALHNAPERIEAVRYLLQAADLVYASTERLKLQLLDYFPDLEVVAGKIYCSGSVLHSPPARSARKVGYMASADHAHNLAMILPAIIGMLDRNPHVGFELFGSIPVPPELDRFGDRITTAPPIVNYNTFLEEFAKLEWDVGICPLTPIPFNLMKANTKWVEYTAVGAAVVASRGTVYDGCCADDCGMLADSVDEWLQALELLVSDDAGRLALVARAQDRLQTEYGLDRLRDQVLDVFSLCRSRAASRHQLAHDLKESDLVA